MPFSIRPYRRFPVHATTLLPGQDKTARSSPLFGVSWCVVSCGVRLSVVGVAELRKPQVVRSFRIAGSIFHRSGFAR